MIGMALLIIIVGTGMAFSSLLDRVSGRYGKMSATGGASTLPLTRMLSHAARDTPEAVSLATV